MCYPICGVVFWSCNVNAKWYAIDNAKVYHGFSKVNLKGVQTSLQKTITWTKKIRKRRQKWKVSCVIIVLLTRMFKTPTKMHFTSQIILFKKTLEYQNPISICHGRQQVLHLFLKCQLAKLKQWFTPLPIHYLLLSNVVF